MAEQKQSCSDLMFVPCAFVLYRSRAQHRNTKPKQRRNTMTLTVKDLTTKAMLVSVSFTEWNETKGDKKANQAVEKETGAGEKAGNYRKRLAAKSAVSPVKNAISNCRDFVKEQTRPWSDAGGYRILPSKNYLYFTTELRKHFSIIENAVVAMVDKYDQMKDDAKAFLVGLYDEEDYPTASEIKAK
jgi:hypothetical protein